MKAYAEFIAEAATTRWKAEEHKHFVEHEHPHHELIKHLNGVDHGKPKVSHKLIKGGKTHETEHHMVAPRSEGDHKAGKKKAAEIVAHAKKHGFKVDHHGDEGDGDSYHQLSHSDGSSLTVEHGHHTGASHGSSITTTLHTPVNKKKD